MTASPAGRPVRPAEPDIHIHGFVAMPKRARGLRKLPFGSYDPMRRAALCQGMGLTLLTQINRNDTNIHI